jgi:hypothetical protein
MSRDLYRLTLGHDLSALGQIGRLVGEHPEFQLPFERAMDSLRRNDPAFYADAQDKLLNNAAWTRPGGPADTFLQLARTLSADFGFSAATKNNQALDFKFKAGISIDPTPMWDRALEQTAHDYAGYSSMLGAKNQFTPGRATTSLVAAHFDRGDWPLIPLYTLGYVSPGGAK